MKVWVCCLSVGLALSVPILSSEDRPGRKHTPSQTAGAQLTALADEFLREFVLANPLAALYFGIPNSPNDSLGDNSLAATRQWQGREDDWLKRLRQINESDLSAGDQVTHGTLLEMLEGSVATRVCRDELWPLNQQGGLQITLATISQLQPVGTEQLRSDALKRWHAMPRFIDTEIQSLQQGLRQGYTLPRANVQAIIEQLDDLLKMPPSQSPFAALGDRDDTGRFADAVREIVGREIMPALGRYRDFLSNDYLLKARLQSRYRRSPERARVLPGARTEVCDSRFGP